MFTNASLPALAQPFDFLPLNFQVYQCFNLTIGIVGIGLFSSVSIFFLLPLYIFVLCLGLKQRRRQQQQQRASTPASQLDFLTYSVILFELLSVLGSGLISLGVLAGVSSLVFLGINMLTLQLFGQMACHILTCLEHYLAVVHPIFYQGLKSTKGIRLRKIGTCCSGLLCFSTVALQYCDDPFITLLMLYFPTILSFIAITFFSLSVLCVLFRPGPAKVGGCRQQVDQSRLRAFNSISAILVVMLVKLVSHIVGICLYAASPFKGVMKCNLWISALWVGLPNALLLPVLYLKRTNVCALNCVLKNTRG